MRHVHVQRQGEKGLKRKTKNEEGKTKSENQANIRAANAADAGAIAAIYGPDRDGTVISFEETAPTADEMARRIASIGATRPWIVLESACSPRASGGGVPRAEDDGAILGYAYASAHHERAAYRWSVVRPST